MRNISGKCCGVLIETDDITLGNITVGWSNESGTQVFIPAGATKPTINDGISDVPPRVSPFYNGSNFNWTSGTYRFLEIRTTGKIFVNGRINADGQGYVGGNAGVSGGVYTNGGRGGYLADAINGDPLDELRFSQAVALAGYETEKARNRVFPGSSGSGGRTTSGGGNRDGSGGSAAGGCGAGFVRLIGDQGIEFGANGKVTCVGLRDGGNGGNGSFDPGNATECKYSLAGCKGTVLSRPAVNWTGGWGRGGNGNAGRGAGQSNGGSPAACCSGFDFGSRSWSSCGCVYWRNDDNCSGPCSGGGCCCTGNRDVYYTADRCSSGNDGYGGAGGGLLLRSFGQISFNQGDIDLTGYNGTRHGGTLKLFHSGLIPNWVLDPLDPYRAKASDTLRQSIGGFYNELLYSGYCIDDDSLKVQSLTSVATQYPAGSEKFNVYFEEGQPFVPNGLTVTHSGYEIYRLIDFDGSMPYPGDEAPPPVTSIGWSLVETVPYSTSAKLGPVSVPINPTHGQVLSDSLGRAWVYNDGTHGDGKIPAWYMDIASARSQGKYFTVNWNDTGLYSYLRFVKGKTYNQAVQIMQDVLYSKKALWYRIKPLFAVGSTTLSPDCGNTATAHPEVTPPKMDVFLKAVKSTPYEFSPPSITGRIPNSDARRFDKYYDNKKQDYLNTASGYDDLMVNLNTPTYWGSFQLNSWRVDWDSAVGVSGPVETFSTMSVSANSPRRSVTTINRPKTYYYPTKYGRNQYFPSDIDPLGYKAISLSAVYNANCYDLSYPTKVLKTARATILEREPTPVIHLSAYDKPYPTAPRNGESRPVGDNKANKYLIQALTDDMFNFRRVVSGYAYGVWVDFFDESVARTFPITSWQINYDIDTPTDNPAPASYLGTTVNTYADTQHIRPDYSSVTYNVSVVPARVYNMAGIYYPTLTVQASASNTSFNLSAINTVKVFPLPPTAQFFNMASSNQIGISAFVPIFFKATDVSLSNSYYPITVWDWRIYDNFDRTILDSIVTKYVPNNVLEYPWRWHTENYELSNITVDSALNNLCLSVRTSAFGWRGRIDQSGTDGLMIEGDVPLFSESVLCKHLYLYERPPVPVITAIEAVTYSSAFTDDNPDFVEYPAFSTSTYVSGYCPFLNVTFQDATIPKSYPVSSYKWNFDDYYNEEFNLHRVNLPLNSWSTGWEYPFPENHGADGSENYPQWRTSETGHTINHIFTLPGLYRVSLTVQASSTGTTRTSYFTAFMVEKPPVCGYEASLDGKSWGLQVLSGEAPLTVYFTPTGVESGSFPIGQLIWDFGDGSEVLTIDRYIDNYTNQPYGSDPRWYNDGIITHTFERQIATQPSAFNVRLSVVSDLSNTTVVCDSIDIGPVKLPAFTKDGDQVHLIKNRSLELKNDNLYVLQRESDKSVYNITLSAG